MPVPDVTLTDDLMAEIHADAARIVAQAFHGGGSPAGAARLEIPPIILLVALQVLVPFIVNVASGLSVEAIRERRAAARTEAKLRTLIEEVIGCRLRPLAREDRDVLIQDAVKDIEAAGAEPDAARAAAERIFAVIEARITGM